MELKPVKVEADFSEEELADARKVLKAFSDLDETLLTNKDSEIVFSDRLVKAINVFHEVLTSLAERVK